jgi:hypothetical protein
LHRVPLLELVAEELVFVVEEVVHILVLAAYSSLAYPIDPTCVEVVVGIQADMQIRHIAELALQVEEYLLPGGRRMVRRQRTR